MDGLSTAASVIAVIQVAAKVASISYNYFTTVKRGPKDARELGKELSSLIEVLDNLQDHLDTYAPAKLPALQKLSGPLQQCAEELGSLQRKLEKGAEGLVKRFVKWPLKEQETAQCIQKIERQKALFMFALTADNTALAIKIEEYVIRTHDTLQDVKSDVRDTVLAVHDIKGDVKSVNLAVQDLQSDSAAQSAWMVKEDTVQNAAHRRSVLNWFFPGEYDTKHLEISERRQEGTGEWLLRSPGFCGWCKKNPESRMLWGHGIPGAGKTFISSLVIDHLQNQAKIAPADYGVAYCYFNFTDQDQQKPVLVLASLVRQLASQIPQLPAYIEELHKALNNQGKRPTLEELYLALVSTLKSFGQVFLVFDALDECSQQQRAKFLPLFRRMGVSGINLFLTSRHHPEDLQIFFSDSAKVELRAKHEDLEQYIRRKIDENPRASHLTNRGDCKERIIAGLTECSNGMFLLVHFQLKILFQQTTQRKILKELEVLKKPQNGVGYLDATYNMAMESIQRQGEDAVELATRIFMWLVKARRTLKVEELQAAVAIEPDCKELEDIDLADKMILLDVCAGLVTIDDNSETIRLAHATVQEFLLKHPIFPKDADFQVIRACTTFLSFDAFKGACRSKESLSNRFKNNPLFGYTTSQLSAHLKQCDEASSKDLVLNFLAISGTISCYSQAAWYKGSPWDDACDKGWSPLHMASSIGHKLVVQTLIERGEDISAVDRNNDTALHQAATMGHDAVLQLLLERGADISALGRLGGTALHMASLHGHEAAVRLLLEKADNVSAQVSAIDNRNETALHKAILNGHEAVARLLLEKGADISAADNRNKTALHKAAGRGSEPIVRLLLEEGADISAADRNGETALHISVWVWGWTQGWGVIRLLLEKGAGVSAVNNTGETALHKAAQYSNEAVVQLLLDEGADMSAVDSKGRTALHIAALHGCLGVLRLLLEKGADISSVDSQNCTTLHLASYNEDEEIIQLLLDEGADISAVNSNGKTPLHKAVGRENEAAVKLLLNGGADISAVDSRGRTALHKAALTGCLEILQLLLEKGADISSVDNENCTILHLAACSKDEEISRLLLEKGAGVSAVNNTGETALHKAAQYSNEAVVQLLLDEGADMSAVDSKGRTALHKAALTGCLEILQLLLEKGADITSVDSDGCTTLHLAVCGGDERIIRLLLEKGAEVSAVNNTGETALHEAVSCTNEAVVQILLDEGADMSTANSRGRTALHIAALHGCLEILRLLLENGADISSVDSDGCTTLHLAARCPRDNEEIIWLLLDEGADISTVDNTGETALHKAAECENEAVVRLLLKVGADISAVDHNGKTALHMSTGTWQGQGVVGLLLEHGAEVSAADNTGETALHKAAYSGSQAVVQLLLEEGAGPLDQNIFGETPLHRAEKRLTKVNTTASRNSSLKLKPYLRKTIELLLSYAKELPAVKAHRHRTSPQMVLAPRPIAPYGL